jgi:hypothetical protein
MRKKKEIIKTPENRVKKTDNRANRFGDISDISSPFNTVLHLHKTLGNQAVQRIMKSEVRGQESGEKILTKVKIGQPNDIYEQEADKVADMVMRMPDKQHIADSPFRSIAYGYSSPTMNHRQYAISYASSKDESVQMKPG